MQKKSGQKLIEFYRWTLESKLVAVTSDDRDILYRLSMLAQCTLSFRIKTTAQVQRMIIDKLSIKNDRENKFDEKPT